MSDDEAGAADERPIDPEQRVREKAGELRMHAELAAVFEGCRKFEAELKTGLDADIARQVQRAMAMADRSRDGNSPLVTGEAIDGAMTVLRLPVDQALSTNDYHVYRRPGEVMIVRWLAGDEVDTFYQRLQAHFDAGLASLRNDERENHGWKQEPATLRYLDTLDELNIDLADRYFREAVRTHGGVMLSTQTADQMNISFLAEHVMGVGSAELVGRASAPTSDEPAESELAWFFKLFLLRGAEGGSERCCFFAFLQKADDDWGLDDEA